MKNTPSKIYDSINVNDFIETINKSSIYQEQTVSTKGEIEGVKATVKFHSGLIIGVLVVVAISFIALVVDAVYFHIDNSNDKKDFYEMKYNTEKQIDNLKSQINNTNIELHNLELTLAPRPSPGP